MPSSVLRDSLSSMPSSPLPVRSRKFSGPPPTSPPLSPPPELPMPLTGAGIDAFGNGSDRGVVRFPSLQTRTSSLAIRTDIPSHELHLDQDDDESDSENPYDNDWLRKQVVKSPVLDFRKRKSGDKDKELLDMMNRNMLLRILHDPVGLHKFTDFVRNNGTVDLLFFYLNCEQLDTELASVKKAAENVYDLHLSRNAPLHVSLPGRNRTQAVHKAKEFLNLQNPYNMEKDRAFDSLYKDHLSAFLKFRLTMLQQKRLRDNSLLAQSALLKEGSYTSHGAGTTGLGDCFCLSDATPGLDTPVCMASDGFVAVSGYTRQECLDRNCRFLQGPQTSPESIARFRKGVQESKEVAELLLNYKKDGTPFWNLCLVSPLKNDHGQTRYFLGCQINVTPTLANENDLDFLLSDEQSTSDTIETTAVPSATEAKKSSFMRLLAKQLKLRKERPQNVEGPTSGLTAGTRLQGTAVVGAEAHLLNVHMTLEDQVEMLHAAYSRFFLIDSTSHVILYRSVQFSSYIQEQWNSASDGLLSAAQVLKRGSHFPSIFGRYNPKAMAQALTKALNTGKNISVSNVVFEDTRRLTKVSSPRLNGMVESDVMMHVTSLKNRNGDIGGWIVVLC